MRALEPWVVEPLETFLAESAARLTLLMTTLGPGRGAARLLAARSTS